ncbi:MAG: 3-dehydroquinate synthase [Candidatus Pelagibacter sp. TMED275]|nr:MAG: 3-dehydroquinate synthase [Candidatus Pelagibacter sp. TMED275]|tara:strand:+ start:986 stop:2089 length:1104 start_codon:yes stop_codon:yes gene_type:complete
MKKYKLTIKTNDHFYPVIIGKNILRNTSAILKNNNIIFQKCLIVYDNKVPLKNLKVLKKNFKYKNIYTYKLNPSEKIKNINTVNAIINFILKKNFHRNDLIVSLGGGIIGDITGFTASIFKRGIKFINIPTTLLSQVDSSIGGKTGVNSVYGKNLIGSFYQPNLVISDINFLKSLPKREITCGYAEILKHSLIKNKEFFFFLDKNINKIHLLDDKVISKSIYESCKIKKIIIEKDPLEKNLRKTLNFGHTFGHAFEANMNYSKSLNHGEAVLLGMYCANNFSYKKKIIKKKEFEIINNHFFNLNLPKKLKKILKKNETSKIINFMKTDKKNFNNKINLILLKKIGSAQINYTYKITEINSFLKKTID